MLRIDRRLLRIAAAAALTSAIGACSTEFNMSDLDPSRKIAVLTRPAWLTYSNQEQEALSSRPVAETDLIGREGQCAAGSGGAGDPGRMQTGIALQMTECEVVSRAGAPDNIEVGVNDRGDRAVAMTFLRGPRPGIYRFVGGRLYSVERGPEPPAAAPARPQRPPAKKSPA